MGRQDGQVCRDAARARGRRVPGVLERRQPFARVGVEGRHRQGVVVAQPEEGPIHAAGASGRDLLCRLVPERPARRERQQGPDAEAVAVVSAAHSIKSVARKKDKKKEEKKRHPSFSRIRGVSDLIIYGSSFK